MTGGQRAHVSGPIAGPRVPDRQRDRKERSYPELELVWVLVLTRQHDKSTARISDATPKMPKRFMFKTFSGVFQ